MAPKCEAVSCRLRQIGSSERPVLVPVTMTAGLDRLISPSASQSGIQPDHERLLQQALAGDKAAFSEICSHYSPRILRTVCRITRNMEDAEDALQDALLRAFVHLRSFDGRSQFCTWLTKIATNSALMILRKKKRHPQVWADGLNEHDDLFVASQIADASDDPEAVFLQNERTALLKEGMMTLNCKLREALETWIAQDASAKKGARHLNISSAAFKTRVTRAKATLHANHAATRRVCVRSDSREAKISG